MNNIELYIDGKLCDTGKDFGVRLNRQLLNPAELNAKDSQYSYSITLPPTGTNNTIFEYSIIEETKNKFNRLYDAELYVNSVRVFKGNFKLSEISNKNYKGNLYIPAAKSIKDIFGDKKLADNEEYRVEFKDFAESISKYNNAADKSPQMAIFPYVLYGLLPKNPTDKDQNKYSPRDIWDESVRVGMQDLPPSINVLKMLKHIFDGRKRNADGSYSNDKPRRYKLEGTAFNDERLTHLYMSYKNESSYVQPWNYGHHAKMKLKGYWTNAGDRSDRDLLESNAYKTSDSVGVIYSSNLFDSNNLTLDADNIVDPGANILYREVQDTKNEKIWKQCQVIIPSSGYYKLKLHATLAIDPEKSWRSNDPVSGTEFLGGRSKEDNNSLKKRRYEVKLLRDRGTGDFGLANGAIGKIYYEDNLRQNNNWNKPDNDENSGSIPKYMPYPNHTLSGKECEIMLVDPAQNPNYLIGLCWGHKTGNSETENKLISDNDGTSFGTVLAAKTGLSWNTSATPTKPSKVGIPNVGYAHYGALNVKDEDESEDINKINFSIGDWVVNKRLDDKGNLVELPKGNTSIVLRRFLLSSGTSFKLKIPSDVNYTGKVFLHKTTGNGDPTEIYSFDQNGELTFDTPAYNEEKDVVNSIIDNLRYLTLYLTYNDINKKNNFDISEILKIVRISQKGSYPNWEQSNKYRMVIDNAPDSYAKRTSEWKAEGEVNAIAWLDAGEILTVVSSSDEGRHEHSSGGKYGWTKHDINFELGIEPFRTDESWLKINSAGNGTERMNWEDRVNFDIDTIDLVKFLPVDVKTDEFIENFCKAFNLILRQTDEKTFKLDVKQTKAAVSPLYINLDSLASVKDRSNSPLGLPSMYKLGFTVNEEEEGYLKSPDNITKLYDDGGGSFITGAVEEKIVEQKSNFSYNWFKPINYTVGGKTLDLQLPIISKAEVWSETVAYPEAMAKRFTSLASRFWYFNGLLDVDLKFNKNEMSIAKVSNGIPNLINLNYKNEVNSILDTYFTVLVNSSSHYTELEGYLTPEQYEKLNGAIMAMFNGDQYYVAEISGYDPLGRNKTKIKLIRKI